MRVWIMPALALLAFAGCSDPGGPWRSRGDRVLGIGSDEAEDPVTGAMVLKKDALRKDYRGSTYYFESPESAEMFDRNPTFYAVAEDASLHERADREVR